jgi:hypothetical protein
MAKDERDDRPDDERMLDELAEDVPAPRGGLTFLAGFVVGALVGAGTALLLAPESGSRARRRLGRRLRRLRKGALERVGDLRDEAERELRLARRRLRRQVPD